MLGCESEESLVLVDSLFSVEAPAMEVAGPVVDAPHYPGPEALGTVAASHRVTTPR